MPSLSVGYKIKFHLFQNLFDLLCHILRRIEKQFDNLFSERTLRKVSYEINRLEVVLVCLFGISQSDDIKGLTNSECRYHGETVQSRLNLNFTFAGCKLNRHEQG